METRCRAPSRAAERKERNHLQRAYPTRLRRDSPSEPRAQRGSEVKGAFGAGGWTALDLGQISHVFTNDAELSAPWGLIVSASQGA